MLYTVLTRMVERGATENLRGKVDVFYAVGSLTQVQYETLAGSLPAV